MAQILHQMGYRNIDRLDPSAGMLEIARGKKIYRELQQLYLQRQVDLPQASYDAIVAAGVLTHGHAPPEAIDGLLGLARNGAVMVFSLSQIAFDEYGFRKKIESREADGSWQKLDQSRLFDTYPFSDKAAHLRHWVLVYRKY